MFLCVTLRQGQTRAIAEAEVLNCIRVSLAAAIPADDALMAASLNYIEKKKSFTLMSGQVAVFVTSLQDALRFVLKALAVVLLSPIHY
jgi:hypothetical protein